MMTSTTKTYMCKHCGIKVHVAVKYELMCKEANHHEFVGKREAYECLFRKDGHSEEKIRYLLEGVED